MSFADLWERVDRVSVGLARAGLRPGARTVLMVPMSIELYVVMLAVLKLGAVGVFVDPWIGRKQIAAFSAFAAPAAWIGIAKSHLLRLRHGELRRIPLAITTGTRSLTLCKAAGTRYPSDLPMPVGASTARVPPDAST